MGSFGVTAIAFDLLLKTALWRLAFEQGEVVAVACSLVLARCAQGLLLCFVPGARADGLASSYACAGAGKGRAMVVVSTTAAALLCALAAGPVRGAVMAVAAGGAVLLLARWYRARIGGITGDCVGAANETVEVAVLATGLLFM